MECEWKWHCDWCEPMCSETSHVSISDSTMRKSCVSLPEWGMWKRLAPNLQTETQLPSSAQIWWTPPFCEWENTFVAVCHWDFLAVVFMVITAWYIKNESLLKYNTFGSVGKESVCKARNKETQVPSLSWEDPLEKKIATCSNILAWKIPWTEESGGYSPKGHKEFDMTEWLSTYTQIHLYRVQLTL